MTLRRYIGDILQNEDLNFALTNRIPRQLLTRFMGWFSRIETAAVSIPSIALFKFFADDLDLGSARKDTFKSLHDCFIRELKDGARSICQDTDLLVSPCDAIVGEGGSVNGTEIFQAKGDPYSLKDLLLDDELVRAYAGGTYVTLRLKANMYHRFHAPHDLTVEQMTYVSGDVWNVNPIALKRVEGLYAKNERAILRLRLATGEPMLLVPVAAVLVASMRFTFTDVRLHLKYKGPNRVACSTRFRKGDEMGHFEHGSTILVFVPRGFELLPHVARARLVRMGEPVMRRCAASSPRTESEGDSSSQ